MVRSSETHDVCAPETQVPISRVLGMWPRGREIVQSGRQWPAVLLRIFGAPLSYPAGSRCAIRMIRNLYTQAGLLTNLPIRASTKSWCPLGTTVQLLLSYRSGVHLSQSRLHLFRLKGKTGRADSSGSGYQALHPQRSPLRTKPRNNQSHPGLVQVCLLLQDQTTH